MKRLTKEVCGSKFICDIPVCSVPLAEVYYHLAAFEDLCDRWGIRNVEEIDRYLRGINAVGGLDRAADLHKKETETVRTK